MNVTLSLLVATVVAASAGAASAQSIAITGATLRSDQGTRDNVTIILKNGRISELGSRANVPAGARVIDAKGRILTTGLIAVGTRLGLVEVVEVVDVGDTNEGGFTDAHPIHAAYNVIDGYNPNSIVIDVARNGGITSTAAAPSGGLIAGQSAWMTLADASVSENTVDSSAALHVTLGKGARGVGDGSRGHALQKLRALFAIPLGATL
ncbi:MAG: hypothetical protein GY811_10510 [Myxococcales bacterium]|nr:hypothetical protein [Myxococcales bacterium]